MKPRDVVSRLVSAARSMAPSTRKQSPEDPPTPQRRTLVWPVRATATSLSAATVLLPVALLGTPDRVRLDTYAAPPPPTGAGLTAGAPAATSLLSSPAGLPTTLASAPAPTPTSPATPTTPATPTVVVTLPAGGGGGAGIPATVLAAYRKAEAAMSARSPGCHVPWWLLAGIGRIESGHAAGGSVDAAGTTTPGRILGPLLDGSTSGTSVITDTDAGRLDGDLTYDRAVGPMQFLPGTWTSFGRDGSGDGVADPNNVFDATLSAGAYLCASGRDLRAPDAMAAAVLTYNNSQTYVVDVLASGAAYRDGRTPPPPWRPALTPAGDPTASPRRPATTTGVPSPAPTTGTPVTRPTSRAVASRATGPLTPTTGATTRTTATAPTAAPSTSATTRVTTPVSPAPPTSRPPGTTGPDRPAPATRPSATTRPPATPVTSAPTTGPVGPATLPPCPVPTAPTTSPSTPTTPSAPTTPPGGSPTCVPVAPATSPATSAPTTTARTTATTTATTTAPTTTAPTTTAPTTKTSPAR